MKTIAIIYAICTLICFIRLALDQKTTSFKRFLEYWYFPFIPVYNLVMTWFVLKEFWLWDRVTFVCCFILLLLGFASYNLIYL